MRFIGLIALLAIALGGCDDGEDPAVEPVDVTVGADAAVDAVVGGDAAPDQSPADDGVTVDEGVAVDEGVEADEGLDLDRGVDPDADPDMAPRPDTGPDPDEGPAPDDGPAPDLGPEPDMAPRPDLGPVGEDVCTPCEDDGECQDRIGFEARCAELIGGRRCLHGCAENDDCAEGFFCIEDRCTPGGARCDSCVIEGCGAEQRCNTLTGVCEDRAGRCGGCRDDNECADGLSCVQVGFVRNCLEPCGAGDACPQNFACEGGACVPESGLCDTCGGGCAGERPICNFITAQCVQCAPGNPCPEGTICDDMGTCVEPAPGVECNTGLDCRDGERPYCDEAICVNCRDDRDCDIGEACNAGRCVEADPCDRVTCQDGARCDEGLCVGDDGAPACVDDDDCPGDDRRCNAATGQCYRADQQCDADGATAVCHPGGDCIQNPINAMENVCTCARRDPGNFQEPNEEHRVPCQPGGTCLQLGADPGVCVRFGG